MMRTTSSRAPGTVWHGWSAPPRLQSSHVTITPASSTMAAAVRMASARTSGPAAATSYMRITRRGAWAWSCVEAAARVERTMTARRTLCDMAARNTGRLDQGENNRGAP